MPTITPLTFNTTISGSISVPGQQDIYTFTGDVGQRLYYDALIGDFSNDIRVRLVDPNGETVFLDQDADTDGIILDGEFEFGTQKPFTLTTAGTYQLILESDFFGTLNTGSYNFQLIDVDNAPIINLNQTITGTLSPGRETDLYSFTGTAGQQLLFDSLTSSQSPNSPVRLYDPNNESVVAFGIGSDLSFSLPVDGTYVLGLQGFSDTDVNYSFQVVDATIPNLTFNTPVSGVVEPGGQQIYTFNGIAGQRLYYDDLTNDLSSTGASVTVFASEGLILATSANNDFLLATLPETRTYTLLVSNSNNDFENEPFAYNFQLLDAGTTPASFNTPIDGTLSPGSETDVYGFTGTAGQRLIFDSLTPGISSADWVLYGDDPFIPIASGDNLSSDFEVTLPFGGTYVLALSGSSETDVNYSFQIIETAISINGTSRRDTLTGTNAVEILTGFQGADILTGGVGRDIFRYTSIVDGGDRITDFTVGSDQIDLTEVLTSVGYTGFNPIDDGYVQFGSRGQQGSFVKIDPDGLSGSAQARNFIFVEGIDIASLSNSNNFIFSTL